MTLDVSRSSIASPIKVLRRVAERRGGRSTRSDVISPDHACRRHRPAGERQLRSHNGFKLKKQRRRSLRLVYPKWDVGRRRSPVETVEIRPV